jgi:Uma2 family endonuclease
VDFVFLLSSGDFSMIQALAKTVTFDEFLDWYPDNSEYRYELHRGVIVQMPNETGLHSQVGGFLGLEIGINCRSNKLPYFVPRKCTVKTEDDTGYDPDIIVLSSEAIKHEPRWLKGSTIEMGSSVILIVEIVSTNWRDDYLTKAANYEAMGIPEYWIVDYLGLGGRRFIGNPKQPTISVYQLVDGEYQINQFRGSQRIESMAFPELNLTAEQIFKAGL